MVNDIVTRLRESDGGYHVRKIFIEAANEIERLRAERDEAMQKACKGEAIIRLQRNRVHRDSEEVARITKKIAVERKWDCFKEATDGK